VSSGLVRGKFVIVGPARVIADAAVYHKDGRIQAVGPYEELRLKYRPDAELGSDAYLVMPGLVNAHQHGRGLSPLQFGILDDSLEPWIHSLWSQKQVDPYWDTLYTCIRLIESGVTATLHSNYSRNPNDWEEEIEASLQAYQDAGIRVAFAIDIANQNAVVYEQDQRFLSSLPKNLQAKMKAFLATKRSLTPEEYFAFFDQISARYQGAGQEKVRILLGPVGPQWVSDDVLRQISRKAAESNAAIHIHMLETMYQKGYAQRTYGKTFGEHLNDLELLGPNVSCAHCVWLSEKDLDILASSGTSVIHNPSANLRLRSGIAPLGGMLARGINVGIGTDNGSLNDDDDIFQDMRLALQIHRVPGLHEWCPSAADILKMATINGAKMSKSLGNYITVRAALKEYDAEVIRLFVLSNHYRSQIDLTEKKKIKLIFIF